MVEKERKYLSLENEPSQDTYSSSPSDYAATSEDVSLEHEMKVGSSSAPNTGSNAMNTEYTYPQVSGCPTASDSNIALEWLQSAPDSADFSKEMSPTFPEGNGADEETLLMNYAFGDSSFFVPVEKPSKKAFSYLSIFVLHSRGPPLRRRRRWRFCFGQWSPPV